jgi:hypothetical protein
VGEELELGEYEEDELDDDDDDDEEVSPQGGEGGEAGQAEAEAYTTLYSGAARDFNVRSTYDGYTYDGYTYYGYTYYGAARGVNGISIPCSAWRPPVAGCTSTPLP